MTRFIAIVAILSVLFCHAPTARAQQASNKTYLKLMEVQELWDAESYNDAVAMLEDFYTKVGDNPYDQAVILQYIGQTEVFRGRIDSARAAMEKALQLPGIDVQLQADLYVMYGQIVLGDEQYELAKDALEFWYQNTTKERRPQVIFSLGYANYMNGDLPRAEEILFEAIGLSENPRDTWYRLYYQCLFDQRKYKMAEAVVLGMVSRSPLESDNWRILANHHLQLEDNKKALSAIAIAYQNDWLEGASDLERMIALYSAIDVPEKSARLLRTHIADNSIEKDADVLKRLGTLWLVARERDNAKVALEEAAAIAPDGRTYELLGNIYFEDENWRAAYDAFLKAVDSGGLDDPERIYLLAGISAHRGGMTDAARAALKQARKSEALRSRSDALLKRLDRT